MVEWPAEEPAGFSLPALWWPGGLTAVFFSTGHLPWVSCFQHQLRGCHCQWTDPCPLHLTDWGRLAPLLWYLEMDVEIQAVSALLSAGPRADQASQGPPRPLGSGIQLPSNLEFGSSEPLGSVSAAPGTTAPSPGGGGSATPPQWPPWRLAYLSQQAQ